MSNKFQVKRTSTAGRTPNTTNSGNGQYIDAGQLALNMPDQILYTSDGSNLIIVGSNTVNLRVTNTATVNAIAANGGVGTAGQALLSNGSATYWGSVPNSGPTIATSAIPAGNSAAANNKVVGVDTNGNTVLLTFMKNTPVAYASLPTASAAGEGARAYITDASATTFASAAAGGGSNRVPVYSNGTSWLIG